MVRSIDSGGAPCVERAAGAIRPGGTMRMPLRTHAARAWLLTVLFALTLVAGSAAQETSDYDIPVPSWVARVSTDLKKEFVVGVARQAVNLAEARATGDVQLLAQTADQLADVADRIDGTMSSIGSIDSSFGITGVSRLLTAEGAVRDTLFGFVVWHESAAGESRQIASDLERAVKSMKTLAAGAQASARQLAANADQVKGALSREDYTSIASSSTTVAQATADLEAVSGEMETAAGQLEALVWRIQDGGGNVLEKEWQQVLLGVSETRRLAAKMRPAAAVIREGSGASEAMTRALDGVVRSIAVMEPAISDADGAIHFPPSLITDDVVIVRDLDESLLKGAGAGYTDDSRSAIEWLLGKIVTSDRILAERAVEYTSTEVGRATDALEDYYKNAAGYDEGADERSRSSALQKVDVALRANNELQSARQSARAARLTFDDGKAKEARGAGFGGAAVEQYGHAWLHSLAAGGSARKAAAGIRK
jgi:hypothetical protein